MTNHKHISIVCVWLHMIAAMLLLACTRKKAHVHEIKPNTRLLQGLRSLNLCLWKRQIQ